VRTCGTYGCRTSEQTRRARAVNLELSPAYEDEAKRLLHEAGFEERAERRLLDIAVDPEGVEPADVVVLYRWSVVGNMTVGKNIRIKGVTNNAFPGPATLNGGQTGTVLQITNGTTTIDGLTITNGASLLNGVFQVGATATNYVSIGGSILPPTSGTEDYVFVGRACNGDPLQANPSGKVALIIRGTCFVSDKGANVAAAGATGAVIFNNPIQPGSFPPGHPAR
jgi:hypothetical protein